MARSALRISVTSGTLGTVVEDHYQFLFSSVGVTSDLAISFGRVTLM